MAQAVPARLDAHFGVDPPAAMRAQARSPAAVPGDVRRSVYDDLAAIEKDWRAFEAQADGTVFQSFDWLSTWQRHIGAPAGVAPAIVVGRNASGNILFLLPLSVRATGFARELSWLGSDLCDYNAPLLAPGFSERFDRARFMAVWRDIVADLQSHPRLGYRPDPLEQNAGDSRCAAKSDAASGRHDQSERRLSDASYRRLGNLLRRQAFILDTPARPHQAQATR